MSTTQTMSLTSTTPARGRRGFRTLARLALGAGVLGAGLGVLGAAQPVGATSPNLYAKVNMDGSLAAGNGVSSAAQTGPAQYEITFARDVTNCAYLATTNNAYSQAVQVFTAGGHLSPNGVYVETKNQGGGLTPAPFDLTVVCGGTGMQYAVVGYSADLVRSTSGTSLTHLGVGRYSVAFPSSITSCAYLATVGDPSNQLVFNPNGVYTGRTGTAVYVETKNGGGGLSDGIPFHLAAICATAPSVSIAVVNADGTPSRASGLTSSFLASTGQYDVVARANITKCATVATRGSVNTAVPYSPSTVEWVPGPAANTVGIQVRNLLFFGGTFDNQSFHLATIC